MTPPFSAPGAAAKPPAETPRAQGAPPAAGVPRPMIVSNVNLGTPVVMVAPSPTPRVQAPPTASIPPGIPMNPPRAAGAAFPAARPRMPLAPHAQGAPIAGVPRPIANFGGGAQMTSAPSPAPRMQAGPPTVRAPGIPPNARAVGAAVQYALPQVANPAAPSLGKRAPTTMGPVPVPAAKRHALMQRPQGVVPMGGVPPPTNPAAPAVGVRAPVPPGHATPCRPPPPLRRLTYVGVYHDPTKGWMARVMDLKRRAARSIGPFDDPHQAALAHDRVAVACAGRGISSAKQLNFPTAFYRVETAFLQRWEGDVCDAVEKGEYEKIYARFLRAGYRAAMKIKEGDNGGEQITDHADDLIASCVGDGEFFWDDIEDFFLYRAGEIGKEALEEEGWEKEDGQGHGRELLRNRFVEMHRNKSLCAVWRRKNHMEKMKTMMMQNQQRQQQIQMQQPQQQQIQMQQRQQQQQQQIHMQQQRRQQQIQQQQIQMQQQRRQQQFQQQQMMIQKQIQQQLMMAQQQEQQYLDDDAICSLDF
ncbi:hypothetical protein ACQ4PT_037169 [Festuca glaucescens]